MATNNNFTVTGIVAVDANVKNNTNGSAWATFPLSIRTTIKVSMKFLGVGSCLASLWNCKEKDSSETKSMTTDN